MKNNLCRKHFQYKNGMFFIDKTRMVLVNDKYSMGIFLSLEKIVGPMAKTIVSTAAKEATQDFLKNILKKNLIMKVAAMTLMGQKKIIEGILRDYYPLLGYGNGKITKFSKDEIVVEITNSVNAEKPINPKSKEVGCITDVAVVQGLIELLTKKEWNGVESRCEMRGDSHCEFHYFPK